ncbi:MAG: ATP synthase A1 subunit C [Candidatus Hydrothermarchaeota archaeon]
MVGGIEDYLAIAEVFGFSDHPQIFFFLVLLLAILCFIIIIIPIIRFVTDIAPYSLLNAKIRAMEAKYIGKPKFNQLLESDSLIEAMVNLGDTEYGKYTEEVLAESKGLFDAEIMFNRCLKDVYEKILHYSPEDAKRIVAAWTKRWEIKNLKKIIRAIHANVMPDINTMIPIGDLDLTELETLADSRSMEEFISKLEGTEYANVLKEVLPDYEEKKSLLVLESALDRYYYFKVWSLVASGLTDELKMFKVFLGTWIDIENIKNLLRLKSENVSPEDIKSLLIPIGYNIMPEVLLSLAEAYNVEEVISGLEGTPYGRIISELLPEYEEIGSIIPFERKLDEFLLETELALSLRQPFSISPLVNYLLQRENEINDIRTVLKCKEEGYDSEQTQKLIEYGVAVPVIELFEPEAIRTRLDIDLGEMGRLITMSIHYGAKDIEGIESTTGLPRHRIEERLRVLRLMGLVAETEKGLKLTRKGESIVKLIKRVEEE